MHFRCASHWFSPEFYSYGFEDVDLGYRCARLGANFFLSQNAVYHLYPSRSQLSYHFDERARTRALTLSSRVFYRHRLDPEIFNEFYPAFFQPVRGELKILASRIVWRVWDILLWRDVIAWKIWQVVLVPALKPYFFLRYQFQKRWPRQSEIEVSRVEY